MSNQQLIFQPATVLRFNAIGAPGERTFFLQGGDDQKLVTLLIEKVQVQFLAIGLLRVIGGIESEQPQLEKSQEYYDEAEMQLTLPVDPLFRVDEIGMGYDPERDLVLLQVADSAGEDERQEVMFWMTRDKMHSSAIWALELASRGRPDPLEPIKPGGNGFRHSNNGHKS